MWVLLYGVRRTANVFGAETEALANPKFHYEADYKVLICKYHGLGIVGLNGHLKDAHNLRKKKERQPILDRYAGLVLTKPRDVAIPPTNGPPFEALRSPLRGSAASNAVIFQLARRLSKGTATSITGV
jgi:hypothetical protein